MTSTRAGDTNLDQFDPAEETPEQLTERIRGHAAAQTEAGLAMVRSWRRVGDSLDWALRHLPDPHTLPQLSYLDECGLETEIPPHVRLDRLSQVPLLLTDVRGLIDAHAGQLSRLVWRLEHNTRRALRNVQAAADTWIPDPAELAGETDSDPATGPRLVRDCDSHRPRLIDPELPGTTCVLPHRHTGWHSDEHGREWAPDGRSTTPHPSRIADAADRDDEPPGDNP